MLRFLLTVVVVAFIAFVSSGSVVLLHKYLQNRHIEQVRR